MNTELKKLQTDGRCSEKGSHELFFSERPAELAQAQMICAGCSVRVSCLEVALRDRYEWGVWGGVIFWDGKPYHRRRGRGRPAHGDRHIALEANVSELWKLVS